MGNRMSRMTQSMGKSRGVAGIMLALLALALCVCGVFFNWCDLESSYHGWGKLVGTVLDLPSREILGYVVTAVPTLIQMAYAAAVVSDSDIADDLYVKVAFWTMWFFDTALDYYQMQTGTTQSQFLAMGTAILVFGFVSEWLTVFFGSVLFGQIWAIYTNWGSYAGAVRTSMGKGRSTGRSSMAAGAGVTRPPMSRPTGVSRPPGAGSPGRPTAAPNFRRP